jgi:hypothetical protein
MSREHDAGAESNHIITKNEHRKKNKMHTHTWVWPGWWRGCFRASDRANECVTQRIGGFSFHRGVQQTKRIWRCVWQVAHQHHVLRWWGWYGVVFVDGGVQRSRRHEDLIVHLHTYKAARDGSGCVTVGVRSDQLSRVDVSQRHTTPLSSSLRKKVCPASLLETRGRRRGHGTEGLPCADVRLCPGQRQAPRATTPPPRMCEKDSCAK